MSRLAISGWRPGFNKVGAQKLLRSHCGLGLAEAIDAVESILARQTVEFELLEDEAAELCAKLEHIGAECSVIVDK
jgi:ribosomal protein L7/L12